MPSPLLLKNELWAADLSSRVEQGSTLMGTFVVKYKYKYNQSKSDYGFEHFYIY